MDISGKKIIVFGGTSGIGWATVNLLCQKGGHEILAIGRHPEKIDTTQLPSVTKVKLDVLDEASLKKFFHAYGKFDVLISAATGGTRALGAFKDMSMSDYQNSFAKLWGYTNVVRHGLKFLNPKGNIVLVSGTPARHYNPGQIAISSVGGAVEAFARGLAKEIAPIRINVIAPGIIDTPMVTLQGQARNDYYTNAVKQHLIPRPGKPEEVAQGIIFAIENEFITGTTIDIDGGWLLS